MDREEIQERVPRLTEARAKDSQAISNLVVMMSEHAKLIIRLQTEVAALKTGFGGEP